MEINEALDIVSEVFRKVRVAEREGGAVDTIRKALAEGQKPPTNSDYAAALDSCISKWIEYSSASDVIEFLEQRLNALKAEHCA